MNPGLWLKSFVLVVLFVAGSRESAAGALALQWDPSPDPSTDGYVVYVGTASGSYTRTYVIGKQTSFLFDEAAEGQHYYFAVAAYAPGNVIGPLSSEVSARSGSVLGLVNPGDQQGVIGQPVALQLTGSSSGGSTVQYQAAGLPSGLSLSASSGLISGTPVSEGSFAVTATASSGINGEAVAFVWTIHQTSPAGYQTSGTGPLIRVSTPSSFSSTGKAYSVIGGMASHDDGVTAVYYATDQGERGQMTGTTTWLGAVPLHSGSNVVTVTAVGGNGSSSSAQITIVRKSP